MNADEMRTLVYGGRKEILGLPQMRKDQGERLDPCDAQGSKRGRSESRHLDLR